MKVKVTIEGHEEVLAFLGQHSSQDRASGSLADGFRRCVGSYHPLTWMAWGVVFGSAVILNIPAASQWWDHLPAVQKWQQQVATWMQIKVTSPVMLKPATPTQTAAAYVFPIAGHSRQTTSIPGNCRPLGVCQRLGLAQRRFQPGEALPKGVRPHAGADYVAPVGTPVLAVQGGRIVEVKPDAAVGGILGIQTDTGELHRYVHMARASVRRWQLGDSVKTGQPILEIGYEDGNWGTAPHLHFERYSHQQGPQWVLDWQVHQWLQQASRKSS
jgi:hypothetical protein